MTTIYIVQNAQQDAQNVQIAKHATSADQDFTKLQIINVYNAKRDAKLVKVQLYVILAIMDIIQAIRHA